MHQVINKSKTLQMTMTTMCDKHVYDSLKEPLKLTAKTY